MSKTNDVGFRFALPDLPALMAAESESRIDAFDAGQITADSAEAVFERINKR